MEVVLRFVIDLSVIYTCLNTALALTTKLSRDSLRVLRGQDVNNGTFDSHSKGKRGLTARDRQYTIPVWFGWLSRMYLTMSRTALVAFGDFGRTL